MLYMLWIKSKQNFVDFLLVKAIQYFIKKFSLLLQCAKEEERSI